MIYLDNAATTFPKPISVTESVAECMAEWCANPGRAGHRMAMKSGEEVYRTRNEIAGLIGCQADEIVFTQNCTGALNLALHGILKPGDHVITTMMEHNSVLRPLNELRMRGVETSIVRCSPEGFPLEGAIEAAIRDNTRMIVYDGVKRDGYDYACRRDRKNCQTEGHPVFCRRVPGNRRIGYRCKRRQCGYSGNQWSQIPDGSPGNRIFVRAAGNTCSPDHTGRNGIGITQYISAAQLSGGI